MNSKVSIVIPVHNEAETIEETANDISDVLEESDFEIIIVEDGSDDGSKQKIKELSKIRKVKTFTSEERLGKGKAISIGFDEGSGDYLVFMDADLSVPAEELKKLLEELEDGSDIAIGSRRVGDSSVTRTKIRNLGTLIYNETVRILLGSDVKDHQCGFKGFKTGVYRRIEPEVDSEGFFWDTELLLEAQRQGLDIREFPVEYKARGEGSFRPFRDLPQFFRGILKELS